jgi:hypothetical protein
MLSRESRNDYSSGASSVRSEGWKLVQTALLVVILTFTSSPYSLMERSASMFETLLQRYAATFGTALSMYVQVGGRVPPPSFVGMTALQCLRSYILLPSKGTTSPTLAKMAQSASRALVPHVVVFLGEWSKADHANIAAESLAVLEEAVKALLFLPTVVDVSQRKSPR